MEATINELWETGRNVISYDNSEFERPQTIADLRKCTNVLVGDKIQGTKMYECIIDNSIYLVESVKIKGNYCGFYGVEVI